MSTRADAIRVTESEDLVTITMPPAKAAKIRDELLWILHDEGDPMEEASQELWDALTDSLPET